LALRPNQGPATTTYFESYGLAYIAHHLGKPKTAKSRRTVEYGEVVADALRRLTDGRANDDFVFVTRARGTSTALRWAGGLP
jgi:integrase